MPIGTYPDIVWINGPFGVGKTTLAEALEDALENAALFDPEAVGYMLRPVLSERRPVSDFRRWDPWREIVAEAALSIHRFVGGTLLMPQTLPELDHWKYLAQRFDAEGLAVRHLLLTADEDVHTGRIDGDRMSAEATKFRHENATSFRIEATWLRDVATEIDTTNLSPKQVVEQALRLLSSEDAAPGGRTL